MENNYISRKLITVLVRFPVSTKVYYGITPGAVCPLPGSLSPPTLMPFHPNLRGSCANGSQEAITFLHVKLFLS